MKDLKIAIVGFGEIGQAFAQLLLDKGDDVKKRFFDYAQDDTKRGLV